MVLRREPWRFKDLGCSSYNKNYVCSVLEVREVGPSELELDFAARGDNSLGALQFAEASVIQWNCDASNSQALKGDFPKSRRFTRPGTRPRSTTYTTNTDEVKEGTMRFDVRPSEVESFIFGESGYSVLELFIKDRLQNEP